MKKGISVESIEKRLMNSIRGFEYKVKVTDKGSEDGFKIEVSRKEYSKYAPTIRFDELKELFWISAPEVQRVDFSMNNEAENSNEATLYGASVSSAVNVARMLQNAFNKMK